MAAGRKEYTEEVWYPEVIDAMIREGLTFSAAAQAMGIKFTSAKEEASHERRKAFQRRYWAMSNAYHNEIGSNPTLNKEVAVGYGMQSLKRLSERGDDDKVATLLKTIADIAGWNRDETQISIIAGFSQAELDTIKAKAKALAAMVKEPVKEDGKVN
jgi:hypothetical protein